MDCLMHCLSNASMNRRMGGLMGCWLYGLVSRQDPAGGTMWFDLAAVFGTDDFYLARVQWAPSPDGAGAAPVLLAQVQSRDQRQLALLRLDTSTGGVENARMTFIVAPEEARRKRRAATRSPGHAGSSGPAASCSGLSGWQVRHSS